MNSPTLLKRALRRVLPPSLLARLRARSTLAQEIRTRNAGAESAQTLRPGESTPVATPAAVHPNPLEDYFDAHVEGHGIWKWRHYFDAYHRHLAKFVGRDVRVLEIGVYSGGSLEMWRDYFGTRSQVLGVDIEPACKEYEGKGVEIHIGDQADAAFWEKFRREVAPLDVVIDDGGHEFDQQRATLLEMLPHLRPGGVYICEDIHGERNPMLAFCEGLARSLHHFGDARGEFRSASAFQSLIASVHQYPFMIVMERTGDAEVRFSAPRRGTRWKPFFDR